MGADTSNQAVSLNVFAETDIAVSCCAPDGSDGARPGCQYGKTYEEAVAICADNGYRLCTRTELEADLTKGMGCNFDGRHNWVSDECDPESDTHHWIVDGSTDRDLIPECMLDTSNQATTPNVFGKYDIAVSCCTVDNTGSDGVRPDCSYYTKTFEEAVQLCTNHGYRLCTREELENDVTKGGGCNFDGRHNWVSDECDGILANHSDTVNPTVYPSVDPTAGPSVDPTIEPTVNPTYIPTYVPTKAPSGDPTLEPTMDPIAETTTDVGASYHWIVDGSSQRYLVSECTADTSNQAVSLNVFAETDIAVSCCAPDGSDGARPGCQYGKTYEEAVAICADNGYRLCTRTELEADLTKGMGCNFDGRHNWVSDECDPESDTHHWIVDGSTDRDLIPECMLDTSNQATTPNVFGEYDIAVSCCSVENDDFHGARPDCSQYSKTFEEAVQLCTEHGYRLCTRAELENDATKGLGCSFDGRHNWVSDECDPATSAHSGSALSAGHHQRIGDLFGGMLTTDDSKNWSISLTAKDLMILALIAANLMLIMIGCCMWARSRMGGGSGKYQPVIYETESEITESEVIRH